MAKKYADDWKTERRNARKDKQAARLTDAAYARGLGRKAYREATRLFN